MSSKQKRDTLSIDEKESLNDNKFEEKEIEHPSDVIGGWGPTQKRVVFYLIVIYCFSFF